MMFLDFSQALWRCLSIDKQIVCHRGDGVQFDGIERLSFLPPLNGVRVAASLYCCFSCGSAV